MVHEGGNYLAETELARDTSKQFARSEVNLGEVTVVWGSLIALASTNTIGAHIGIVWNEGDTVASVLWRVAGFGVGIQGSEHLEVPGSSTSELCCALQSLHVVTVGMQCLSTN